MLKFFANSFLQVVRCRFRLDTLFHYVSMHWVNKNTWAKFILLVTLVYSSLGVTVATNFFSVHSNWNYLKNIAFSKAPKKPPQKNFSKNASPIFPAREPQTQYMQRNERGRLTGRLCAKGSPWSIAHSDWANWLPSFEHLHLRTLRTSTILSGIPISYQSLNIQGIRCCWRL